MSLKKVTAIFDELRLQEVEDALLSHCVSGFTVHNVRGRGNYFDSYNEGRLISHLQLDIYTNEEYADEIARLIVSTAFVNADGEGLVSVIPVDSVYWIHSQQKAQATEFIYREVKDDEQR